MLWFYVNVDPYYGYSMPNRRQNCSREAHKYHTCYQRAHLASFLTQGGTFIQRSLSPYCLKAVRPWHNLPHHLQQLPFNDASKKPKKKTNSVDLLDVIKLMLYLSRWIISLLKDVLFPGRTRLVKGFMKRGDSISYWRLLFSPNVPSKNFQIFLLLLHNWKSKSFERSWFFSPLSTKFHNVHGLWSS